MNQSAFSSGNQHYCAASKEYKQLTANQRYPIDNQQTLCWILAASSGWIKQTYKKLCIHAHMASQ